MVLYGILLLLGVLLLGYLVGSISNSVWISKWVFHKDIRQYGSHNAGGTNMGRVLGKKWGVLIIFLDALKAAVMIWGTYLLLTYTSLQDYCLGNEPAFYYYPVSLAVSLGHCYPLYTQFKGGKAASVFTGTVVSTSWISTIGGMIAFFTTLKAKKFVSLASIVASFVSFLASLLVFISALDGFSLYPALSAHYMYPITMFLQFVLLVLRHRANIKRLKEGNENRVTWL